MFDWKGVDGRVMGVINVTPDSFSDGGRYLDPDAAIAHGLELAAEGAAMLDVGGASSRPGAEPVDADEEARRVVPVIRGLADETAVPISVDTMSAQVAQAALDAGAVVVNDVSAGRFDPAILDVTAGGGAGYVAVHMQGEPRTMQVDPRYDDVVGEVGAFLLQRLEVASGAGIRDAALMADPGIGFGKTIQHNLELLARLPELVERVHAPLLIGTSRKTFIGRILGVDDPERRDDGTLATVAWSLDRGAAMVRVHDVRRAVQVAKVLDALARVTPVVRT
jgi:dihydropteroate synthase